MERDNKPIAIMYMSNILSDVDIKKLEEIAEVSNMPLLVHENKTQYWASIDDFIDQVVIFLSDDLIKNLLCDAVFLGICKLCSYIKSVILSHHIKRTKGDKVKSCKMNIHVRIKNIVFIMQENLDDAGVETFIKIAIEISNKVNFQNEHYAYYNNKNKEFNIYTHDELIKKFYSESKNRDLEDQV